jgi:transcriptional regulator with XRE-family HTH domain
MSRLADVLRTRRESQGIEQGELARRVGVTQQTVSKWETSVTVPRPGRMAALARALDLDAGLLHATAGLAEGDGHPSPRRGGRPPKGIRLGDLTEAQLVALLDASWRELQRRRQVRGTNHASRR